MERGELALALEFFNFFEHAGGLRLDHILAKLAVPVQGAVLREELPLLDSEVGTFTMVPLVAHVTADYVLVVIHCSIADAVDLSGIVALSIRLLVISIIDRLSTRRIIKLKLGDFDRGSLDVLLHFRRHVWSRELRSVDSGLQAVAVPKKVPQL